YSSIMDYAGRYTIDGLGVGKYDRAAILFGYADKIEVFKKTGDLPASVLNNWFEQRGDILWFSGFSPFAYHYTQLYKDMGELLYNADNRMLVDVSSLKVEDGQLDWSTAVVDGEEYSRVPYIYCSHT